MSIWIAGITRGHNGAVCLLKDGEVVNKFVGLQGKDVFAGAIDELLG